jgi:hypothetical protein
LRNPLDRTTDFVPQTSDGHTAGNETSLFLYFEISGQDRSLSKRLVQSFATFYSLGNKRESAAGLHVVCLSTALQREAIEQNKAHLLRLGQALQLKFQSP